MGKVLERRERYMATWSLLISFVMCLLTGLVTTVEKDDDGEIKNTFTNKYAAMGVTIVRYPT